MTGRARRVIAIARRELAGMFHAPVAWVVGVLFLFVQGMSFWAVVEVLADPARHAPLGAVLRTYFGGTLLYWSVLFALVAALAMRLIADDRRRGTWEALLTTPVAEGEAVIGKWLGGLAFYAALWLPTLVFPVLLRALAPPGASPELAPVATAYVGVVLSGAGLLAIGLAASARTANPLIAAVAAFVALAALLVIGQLPQVVPALRGNAVLATFDVRAHMDAFARGEIDARWVAFDVGATGVGLAIAAATAGIGRRRAADVAARAAAAGLVIVVAVLANALVARHPGSWDVSGARVNSLDDDTRRALDELDTPVTAYLVRAGAPGFDQAYDEIERVLRRMARAQRRLRVSAIDPMRDAARVDRLADDGGVPADVLRGVGAVVFVTADGRARTVELLDMADLGRDELDVGAVLVLRAEAAFSAALLELSRHDRPRLCATSGHGELPLAARPDGRAAARLVRQLQRAGYRVGDVGALLGGVPNGCRALLVLGPARALSPDEALAVDAYLRAGGRLLLAIDARVDGAGLVRHGLELVIGERGLRTPDAVVVDPGAGVGIDYAWGALAGYADHPVTAGFAERRLTVWTTPRPVLAEGDGAVALVRSSATGWAETDVAGLLGDRQVAPDAGERVGAVPVAAAAEVAGARLVVLGAARPLSSGFGDRRVGDNAALAVAAVDWLTGRTVRVGGRAKTPERIRLLLSRGARRAVFALCVFGLPLAWAVLGAVVWWRRRRRG